MANENMEIKNAETLNEEETKDSGTVVGITDNENLPTQVADETAESNEQNESAKTEKKEKMSTREKIILALVALALIILFLIFGSWLARSFSHIGTVEPGIDTNVTQTSDSDTASNDADATDGSDADKGNFGDENIGNLPGGNGSQNTNPPTGNTNGNGNGGGNGNGSNGNGGNGYTPDDGKKPSTTPGSGTGNDNGNISGDNGNGGSDTTGTPDTTPADTTGNGNGNGQGGGTQTNPDNNKDKDKLPDYNGDKQIKISAVRDETGIVTVTIDDANLVVPVQTTYFNNRVTKSGVAQGKIFGYNVGVTVMLFYPQDAGFNITEANGYMSRSEDGLTVLVDINGDGTKLLIKVNGMKSLF